MMIEYVHMNRPSVTVQDEIMMLKSLHADIVQMAYIEDQ